MASKETRASKVARILVALFAITAAVGVLQAPAVAAPTPPFEVVFPQDPEATSFSDSWGYPRPNGRTHKGNDLMAPKMTEVYAAAAGVVEAVSSHRTAGRYVRIRHEAGWKSYYMHLNNDSPDTDDGSAPWSLTVAENVAPGAYVTAGQLIGWVGDSGLHGIAGR